MDNFFINGVSAESVGLHVDTVPIPPMAKQRYTTWQNGGDEDGTSSDDTYQDVNYPITAYVFKGSYDDSEIHKFIVGAKILQISRLDGFYFKVRQAYIDTDTEYDGNRIRYTFNFVLAPFRYINDNSLIEVSDGGMVANDGTRYSKPNYFLTAINSGDVKLIVNGEEFKITGCSEGEAISVYSEKYIAVSGNKSINQRTYGYFPFLGVGNNQIYFENCTCKLQTNARCY